MRKRILYGIGAVTAFIAIAILILLYNANRIIEHELQRFLGKGFSVADVSIRWGHVEARDVKLLSADNKETFSSADIKVSADILALLKKENVISDISLSMPHLLIEVDEKGNIVVPWVTGEKKTRTNRKEGKAEGRGVRPMMIHTCRVNRGSIDYLDKKVSARPVLLQLTDITARVEEVSVPAESRASTYEFEAAIPGRMKTKGYLRADGELNLKTKDTQTKLEMRDIDIVQLRPYFEKKGDAEVSQGLLSLDADITVHDKKIRAAGRIRIKGLEFKKDSGNFMGVPQLAVLKLLKDNQDQISLEFTIQGDLNNPKFSITESLVRKLTLSLATAVGMPIESLGKSILDLGGSALEKLFR